MKELLLDYQHVDGKSFRQALRLQTAGVAILTTGVEELRAGITVTSVVSVSLDPPTMLVCVNNQGRTGEILEKVGFFTINFTAPEHRELAKRFAGMTGVQGDERFTHGHWETAISGTPVLADALASFECSLQQAVTVGSHTLYIGAVLALRLQAERPPLVWHQGDFRLLEALPDVG